MVVVHRLSRVGRSPSGVGTPVVDASLATLAGSRRSSSATVATARLSTGSRTRDRRGPRPHRRAPEDVCSGCASRPAGPPLRRDALLPRLRTLTSMHRGAVRACRPCAERSEPAGGVPYQEYQQFQASIRKRGAEDTRSLRSDHQGGSSAGRGKTSRRRGGSAPNVPRPRAATDDFERRLEARNAVAERDPESSKLGLVPARTEAENEAAARHFVDRRSHAGQSGLAGRNGGRGDQRAELEFVRRCCDCASSVHASQGPRSARPSPGRAWIADPTPIRSRRPPPSPRSRAPPATGAVRSTSGYLHT